eukprot:11312767-Karenia_brevis.AAC.1
MARHRFTEMRLPKQAIHHQYSLMLRRISLLRTTCQMAVHHHAKMRLAKQAMHQQYSLMLRMITVLKT